MSFSSFAGSSEGASLLSFFNSVSNSFLFYKQIRNDLYGIKRQNWCPLKLLPEKDTKNHFPDEFEDGYAIGWNACIDEITGDD